jgi:flagellar biogenesis protein FliO
VAASGNGSSALPADWPLRRDADSGSPGAVGYLLWLVPVVGALAVLGRFQIRRGRRPAWLMKFRDDSPRVLLKVIAAVPLGSGNSLQIVQWGGEELLLGCTGQTINLLKSRAAAASVDSASHARSATAAGCPEKS